MQQYHVCDTTINSIIDTQLRESRAHSYNKTINMLQSVMCGSLITNVEILYFSVD